MDSNLLIMKYAKPGEVHITNGTIRDDEKINTAKAYESEMRALYPDYELRFDYEHIVYAQTEVLNSIEFGFKTTNLPRGHARGVSVYGKLKKP